MLGPYDFRPSYFGQVLLALCQKQLPALVAGGFNWVDVRDVAEGAMAAEARAPIGGRYLLPGHWASLRELAAMVTEITWTRSPRLVVPMWIARLGAPFCSHLIKLGGEHPLFTSVSLRALRGNRMISRERAARHLDYHPRPLSETLEDTLRWFATAGRLPRPLAFHIMEET
jgi:dihydroflavonol-4-reductase